MRHEGGDLAFEIVVLKQDAVLERPMPALDLTLGVRVIRGTADILHLLAIQPLREIRRDVIRQQARSVPDCSPLPFSRNASRRSIVVSDAELSPASERVGRRNWN